MISATPNHHPPSSKAKFLRSRICPSWWCLSQWVLGFQILLQCFSGRLSRNQLQGYTLLLTTEAFTYHPKTLTFRWRTTTAEKGPIHDQRNNYFLSDQIFDQLVSSSGQVTNDQRWRLWSGMDTGAETASISNETTIMGATTTASATDKVNTALPVATTLSSSSSSTTATATKSTSQFPFHGGSVTAGPSADTKPNYDEMIGPLGKIMDTIFLVVFRLKLAEQVTQGIPVEQQYKTAAAKKKSNDKNDNDNQKLLFLKDSKLPLTDYQGIVELAMKLNRKISNRYEVQRRAHETLRSLFPSWLPRQYAKLFSQPFPAFAARMNAWATYVAGTWLMGECEVNDAILSTDEYNNVTVVGKNQGLLVKRCRFLEESQCASVCVNSCKIPTQTFFLNDMGLPLTMEPNYETFECQFSFGKLPTLETEQYATQTPCLQRCPALGSLRQDHGSIKSTPAIANSRNEFSSNSTTISSITDSSPSPAFVPESGNSSCIMMNET